MHQIDINDYTHTDNNAYECIVQNGILYQPVKVDNIETLYARAHPLRLLNNHNELLEKFRLQFSSFTEANVLFVDDLEVEKYVRGNLFYFSNGGIACTFHEDKLILVRLSRNKFLNSGDPYDHSQYLRFTIFYLRDHFEFKDNEYHLYVPDPDCFSYRREEIMKNRKELELEIKPSMFTKSAMN